MAATAWDRTTTSPVHGRPVLGRGLALGRRDDGLGAAGRRPATSTGSPATTRPSSNRVERPLCSAALRTVIDERLAPAPGRAG